MVHKGAPTWYSNRLLESLYVVEQVPASSNNRLKSLVQARKRYVVDPALAAAATRMTPDAVLRDVDMPMCALGLNAEKVDPSAGAGAGDSTPETGTLTVTDPVFRTVL